MVVSAAAAFGTLALSSCSGAAAVPNITQRAEGQADRYLKRPFVELLHRQCRERPGQPTAFYQLEESSGTTAIDSSSNGFHGTISDPQQYDYTPGSPGCQTASGALTFNGTSSHVT